MLSAQDDGAMPRPRLKRYATLLRKPPFPLFLAGQHTDFFSDKPRRHQFSEPLIRYAVFPQGILNYPLQSVLTVPHVEGQTITRRFPLEPFGAVFPERQ